MRRILIIDDEDDIREVAALCMELFANWEVIKACSGDEGLERALQHKPDAIILDMKMPYRRARDACHAQGQHRDRPYPSIVADCSGSDV